MLGDNVSLRGTLAQFHITPQREREFIMDVRAAVAIAAGKPLEITTVQLDGPREGEVMVEIKATGVCHTDEFTLSGADPEGLFPAILGHEGAGVVVDDCNAQRITMEWSDRKPGKGAQVHVRISPWGGE